MMSELYSFQSTPISMKLDDVLEILKVAKRS